MGIMAEIRQIFYDLPLSGEPGRDVVAHFCEHDGIRIEFQRARTSWYALTPSSMKPWWLVLDPIIRNHDKTEAKEPELVSAEVD